MISLTISLDELESMKGYIIQTGLKREKVKSEYELLRIKDGNIRIIIYKSGKLVHNNSEETNRVLRQIMKSETEFDYMLGSDETGKGEWYGPLVACCVAFEPPILDAIRMMGVRDSKSLKIDSIMELANKIIDMKPQPVFNSRILLPETYNRMYAEFKNEGKNLNDLLAWAHSAAIKDTLDKIQYRKAKLVIDKFDVEKTYRRLYTVDNTRLEIIQKSKGETEIPVAAASILAKRAFELTVDELNSRHGVDLRNQSPGDILKSVLPLVAKTHFKNVEKYV